MVTITGGLPGIELARQRIRDLLPMNFIIDISAEMGHLPHINEIRANLESFQKAYRITARLQNDAFTGYRVLVRGPQNARTLNGVESVWKYFFENKKNEMQVTTKIDIPTTYQMMIINSAKAQEKLKETMMQWQTSVLFPCVSSIGWHDFKRYHMW